MSRPSAVSSISATRRVLAGPDAVHRFLADMGNHWQLGGRHLQLEELRADGRGGWITLQGPIGLRRRVRTEITHQHAPYSLVGWAHIGTKTQAQISWRLLRNETGADVHLTAALVTVGTGDRVMLALGGRRWLSARFEEVLDRLAEHVAEPRPPSNSVVRSRPSDGIQRATPTPSVGPQPRHDAGSTGRPHASARHPFTKTRDRQPQA